MSHRLDLSGDRGDGGMTAIAVAGTQEGVDGSLNLEGERGWRGMSRGLRDI